MEVNYEYLETSEGPKEITKNNVIYWDPVFCELRGQGFAKKAHLFLLYDCIKYMGQGTFVCLPLNRENAVAIGNHVFTKKAFKTDYNWSSYELKKIGQAWSCNCQGHSTRIKRGAGRPDGVNCSHTLSLMLAFSAKVFK